MGCEASIGDVDQFLVKRALVSACFIAADEDNGLPLGGANANAKRQTPSSALNRSSFIFGKDDPLRAKSSFWTATGN